VFLRELRDEYIMQRKRDQSTQDALIARYRDKRHAHSLARIARQRALRLSHV
jgi:hypothetical protein